MANKSSGDRIDNVAPGDIITVDNQQPFKVVHKQSSDGAFIVTFEKDNGETFQQEFAAGTHVIRSPDAKWESSQSPTPETP
jgi:hypothetical protein